MIAAVGNFAREAALFGLAYLPAAALAHLAAANFDELQRSPWFVAARLVLVNVLLPAAYAIWRVRRKQRKASAECAKLRDLSRRQARCVDQLIQLIARSALTEEQRVEARAILLLLESNHAESDQSAEGQEG